MGHVPQRFYAGVSRSSFSLLERDGVCQFVAPLPMAGVDGNSASQSKISITVEVIIDTAVDFGSSARRTKTHPFIPSQEAN
jgi:hypothetical protein